MTSANLELVRSVYAAWERGDYSTADWAHPEIEMLTVDGPAPGRWTGLAGMADGFRSFSNAWDHLRQEAEEYRELDASRVLVLLRWGGRGKTSGLDLGEMEAKGASLFELRSGKVTRLVIYFNRERALADLGIAANGD